MTNIYDYDNLITGTEFEIKRHAYLNRNETDISALTEKSTEELNKTLEEAKTAEQDLFNELKQLALKWDQIADNILMIKAALEYKATTIEHTSNEWICDDAESDCYRYHRSNAVYHMYVQFSISEGYQTAYKTVPDEFIVTWLFKYNSVDSFAYLSRIAGQINKKFKDKDAAIKYINGRVKHYNKYFLTDFPPVPNDVAYMFKVNDKLLPGYQLLSEIQAESDTF